MKYLANNKIKEFMIDILLDRLDCYETTTHYGSDLGMNLFEQENSNGTYFFNRDETKKWICENYYDLGEIMEELKFNFGNKYLGELLSEMFDNPEKIMVVVMLEVSSYLIGQCETVEKYWNDEFTLTKENIIKIKLELLEQSDIDRTEEIETLEQEEKEEENL